MFIQKPNKLINAMLVLSGIALVGVVGWVGLEGAYFRPEAFGHGLALTGGGVMLTLFGLSLWAMFNQRRWDEARDYAVAIMPFWLVAGQIALVVYVLVRSFLAHHLLAYGSFALPVTRLEIIGLIVAVIAASFAKERRLWALVRNNWWEFAFFFLAVFVWFEFVALKDCPRGTGLSSDPDQHAFLLSRVIVHGGVPFNLGEWGSLSTRYPVGFSLLNFVWHSLSVCSVFDIITIQPMVQSCLAVLILSYLVGLFFKDERRLIVVSVTVLLFCLYWLVVPYGYDVTHWHSQGTARASSLALSVIPLALWVTSFSKHQFGQDKSLWLLAYGAVLVSILIHPVNCIISAALVGLCVIVEVVRRRLSPVWLIVFLCCLFSMFSRSFLSGANWRG